MVNTLPIRHAVMLILMTYVIHNPLTDEHAYIHACRRWQRWRRGGSQRAPPKLPLSLCQLQHVALTDNTTNVLRTMHSKPWSQQIIGDYHLVSGLILAWSFDDTLLGVTRDRSLNSLLHSIFLSGQPPAYPCVVMKYRSRCLKVQHTYVYRI